MHQFPKLTLEEVKIGIEGCKKRATAIGVPMDIAITDETGNLLAFERMNGALVGCIQIAIDKAYTASVFGVATEELGSTSQPGGPDYGLNTASGGRFIIFAGGVPIRYGKNIVGGVGCSSGTAQQDADVAMAGVSVIQQHMSK